VNVNIITARLFPSLHHLSSTGTKSIGVPLNVKCGVDDLSEPSPFVTVGQSYVSAEPVTNQGIVSEEFSLGVNV
jgi:hypothetical protein